MAMAVTVSRENSWPAETRVQANGIGVGSGTGVSVGADGGATVGTAVGMAAVGSGSVLGAGAIGFGSLGATQTATPTSARRPIGTNKRRSLYQRRRLTRTSRASSCEASR